MLQWKYEHKTFDNSNTKLLPDLNADPRSNTLTYTPRNPQSPTPLHSQTPPQTPPRHPGPSFRVWAITDGAVSLAVLAKLLDTQTCQYVKWKLRDCATS